MFWRLTGLSATSPMEAILDKESYTLEELLDEDDVIQECKVLNTRLINFLREKNQVKQLLRYIVEEPQEEAEKKHFFKFPFIACEIITCEVDIILNTLVEDEELMNLLFSFLKPDRSHSTLLAGYFSKVVICLMLRKTIPLMNFIQAHREILQQLVDLIGITSIMEVLIRFIGADEHMNFTDSMPWLEDSNILELIVDKFSLSDSPEVHANVAETLCAITRCCAPAVAAKIFSPSFVARLFHHAFGDSRPKSVLIHSLTICISLIDPRRLVSAPSRVTHGVAVNASPEMVDCMLENLGHLVKLLDISTSDIVLPTTYGSLRPPLGKLRLKIVEFIFVLMTTCNEASEKELVEIGAIRCILDLFFEYPYNNFLHHHVEGIIICCLESKRMLLVEHLLYDCHIVDKILGAEKSSILSTEANMTTVPADGKPPPRIGNIGHISRISNKLAQLANNNDKLKVHLQESNEWVTWYTNVLVNRNSTENIYQWTCGRPATFEERNIDSDDEEFKVRAFDIATFLHNDYSNDDIEEAHRSLEQDDEEVYFDDSAEVIMSSLRLGDDHDSISAITNPDWLAFKDDDIADDECKTRMYDSPYVSSGGTTKNSVCENDTDHNADASQIYKNEYLELSNGFSRSSLENAANESEVDSVSTTEVKMPLVLPESRGTSGSGSTLDSQPTVAGSIDEPEPNKDRPGPKEMPVDIEEPSPSYETMRNVSDEEESNTSHTGPSEDTEGTSSESKTTSSYEPSTKCSKQDPCHAAVETVVT